MEIMLNINGESRVVDVGYDWTLQYTLHNRLGINSIKDMCGGRGECGSCTVILDGRAVLSCMILAVDCEGKNIETLEGIVKTNHPLIKEYVKNYCMQCGYCTPGFIVTAKALLDRNPKPTQDEIKQALAGNICRCGTYPQHIKAVLSAAEELRRQHA
jgi:aerobic-type carbon monoxide dehydrogenase small subunit (CoxS/CutS family)